MKILNKSLPIAFLVSLLTLSSHAGERILIAMSPEVRSMCQQAEQLINSRKFKEALQLLNQAANMDPNCAEVHGYLGMAYQNSLNMGQAIPEYTKALELNPQMSFINVNLGTCYLNMNRPDQAVPYFQRYLQENPNAPDAAQVRKYIQQAGSSTNQQNMRGVMEQGQMLLKQNRFEEARQAFHQATTQSPTFAPAQFYLGYSLGQLGRFQDAIGCFQEALRLDPNMKEATMNIASNYQSLGDCGNAITWYERYLKQYPNSPKAADVKGRIDGLRRQMAQQPNSGNPGGHQPSPDYFGSIASNGVYFRWPRMPVRVCITPGGNVAGFDQSYQQALMDAFSTWAQASENRLLFTLVQDPSQADILCRWTGDASQIAEPGRPIEGGLTKLSAQPMPDGSAGITQCRMTLLTNRGGTPLHPEQMKRVCLHEVGHALGLSGHSNNNQDIMFFSETTGMPPVLTQRDKATICRLYANYPRQQ